jgi:hypothetical protein
MGNAVDHHLFQIAFDQVFIRQVTMEKRPAPSGTSSADKTTP